MNSSKKLITPLLVLLITSCAGIKLNPPSPGFEALLVLPVTVANTSSTSLHGYNYKYEIVDADNNRVVLEPVFELPNPDGFLLINSLPPGYYYVNKLESFPVGAYRHRSAGNSSSRYDRFQLVPGRITIFQHTLYVLLSGSKKRGVYDSKVFMNDTGPAKEAEIVDSLKKHKNFSSWKILRGIHSTSSIEPGTTEDLTNEIGESGSKNYEVKIKRLKLTAEQGDAVAQYQLGRMYALGQGVSKNLSLAYMWWHISAGQRYKDAIRARGIIEEQMTPEQVAKALDLAVECIEKNYKGC